MNAADVSRVHRLVPLVAAWMVLLAIETLGQVALKLAGDRVGAFDLDRASVLLAVRTPWLWLGLACYLGQFTIWMAILERSSLSLAFPISAIAFVAVMVASRVVFGDPMGSEKILGSIVIIAGILLLGSDSHSGRPTPTRDDPFGKPA